MDLRLFEVFVSVRETPLFNYKVKGGPCRCLKATIYVTQPITSRPPTEVIKLTLALKMTSAQVVETSVTVLFRQDYVHREDHIQPTYGIIKIIIC